MRKKLIEKRKAARLTQQNLGKKTGVSRSTIAAYEAGNIEPSLKTSLKIKEALGYYNDNLFENIVVQPIIINLKTPHSNKIYKNQRLLER